jgi:hypothetical protein
MAQQRIPAALVALLATVLLVAPGCGPSGNQAEPTGTDSDETAPAEAQDAIVNGLETMFTWYPARDASTDDAYTRALPYLGAELRATQGNRLERGNSVWWQEWKAKKAEVTADALLVAGEHPADQPDTVQRAVVVTQTVKTPDGKELEQDTMRIDRVVAKKNPDGWRVEEISFFPVNEFRTSICPPGQSHQPPPDGPCVVNPPPPPPPAQTPQPTQPPGTATPAPTTTPPATTTATTPPPPTTTATTSPTTTTDTTTSPTTTTTPPVQQCPGGTTLPANQTCPPPTTCWDGSTVYAPQTCPPEPIRCGDGSTVPAGHDCPAPTTCWDGSTVYPPTACPTSPTPEPPVILRTVPQPPPPPPGVTCWDGSVVPTADDCPFRPPR